MAISTLEMENSLGGIENKVQVEHKHISTVELTNLK